jgi:hypothetical protein
MRITDIDFSLENVDREQRHFRWSPMQKDKEGPFAAQIGKEQPEETVYDKGLYAITKAANERCQDTYLVYIANDINYKGGLEGKQGDEGGNRVQGNHDHDSYDHPGAAAVWLVNPLVTKR